MGYLSGQGKLYRASRDANGNPLGFQFMGNIPSFQLALTADIIEHKESTSGNRLIDLRLVTGHKTDLTLNVQEFTPENLQLLLQGNVIDTGNSPGSVTGEQLNGGLALVAGGNYMLQAKNPTSVVLTDSAGTPATLAVNTNYTLNAPYGMIQAVGSQSGFTPPIKAAYTKPANQKTVDIFTAAQYIQYLRLFGINTAQLAAGVFKRFVLDLYNVQFDPTSSLQLINDAVADMELKGSVLVDSFRDPNAVGGAIGQLTWIDA